MHRSELLAAFDNLLQPQVFKDYGPNGLQVEGREQIHTLVSGVTASRALIEAAITHQADAIFVHHGLFWRGQSGTVTGWMKQRLALLLGHDINLFAYHLPLDAHPEWGNNAQLGQRIGLLCQQQLGEQNLIFMGTPDPARHTAGSLDAQALAHLLEQMLNRTPIMVDGTLGKPLKRIAWCSGGAQGFLETAIAAGADAYITGEISEPQAHLARECQIAFYACGHHATERFGAPATAAYIAAQHGLKHVFIDVDNPA